MSAYDAADIQHCPERCVIMYRAAGPMFWAEGSVQKMVYHAPHLLGRKLIVVDDGYREWLREIAPSSEQLRCDPYNADEVLAALEQRFSQTGEIPIGIITFAEEVILQYARCAEALSLPGPSVYAACRSSADKVAMKEALASNGVPTARYLVASDVDDIIQFIEQLGYPAVIKPSVGGGSVGVYLVRCRSEALSLVEKLRRDIETEADITFRDFSGGFLVEEFIEGDVVSVDGVVQLHPMVCGLTGTVTSSPPTFWQEAAFAPPLLNKMMIQKCQLVAFDAIRATGIDNCAFHCECIVSDDGSVNVIEIACRAPGGFLPEMHKHTYGLDLIDLSAKIALGDKLGLIDPVLAPEPRLYTLAPSVFPHQSGVLRGFLDLPAVIDLESYVSHCSAPIGSRVSHCGMSVADVLLVSEVREICMADGSRVIADLQPIIE